MLKREYDEINTGRGLLDFKEPLDYELMMRYLDIMVDRYPFMSVSYIGESILGKGIPMITLGEGEKRIVYVGAHSAGEWRGSILLLKFINEYCEALKNNENICKYNIKYLFGMRQLCIIPMLNPDGVDININGISEDNILYSRLLSMNGGSDFSAWQANARGVTLSCNYRNGFSEYRNYASKAGIISGAPIGYSGEMPESEPEIGALCSNIRFSGDISASLCIDGIGERIFYKLGDKIVPKSRRIAESFTKMSGYSMQKDFEIVTNGGFMGFCIEELNIPSFNLMVGKSKDGILVESTFEIYTKIREMLFSLPTLV